MTQISVQERLQQTLAHLQPNPAPSQLSIVQGPTDQPLWNITLGQLLERQRAQYGSLECVVFPWSGVRWTYAQLDEQANRLAKGLLAMGISKGDRIGIMAGNCEEYVVVFFAAARVGAILVVLNNTYTPLELYYALDHSECRLLFLTPRIGRHSLHEALTHLGPRPKDTTASQSLEEVVLLRDNDSNSRDYPTFTRYSQVLQRGKHLPTDALVLRENELSPDDVCNLQYTSGSTGSPKAAMLTHHNLVNNARFIGDRMAFTSLDILCCPPPLFHCFGLVLGLLAVLTHGAKIVFPAETFDAPAVLRAISDEACTALHGVPTMFESILALPKPEGFVSMLRTGIIAGAPVPKPLMERLLGELNMTQFTSSYGLTEASPTCFNALTTDTIPTRLETVGRVMPHARAKIIDAAGSIVPVGQRGELCIAGYQLSKGYWKSEAKTAETFVTDTQGTRWLKTGDEALFTPDGHCTITGRFKDIIIRGGENIYPLEIEERLGEHAAVVRAAVVGVPDERYGEVVAAFVLLLGRGRRPGEEELREWTRMTLGRHKAPVHFFYFGEEGVEKDVPVTGSGKVRKGELRDVAVRVLEARRQLVCQI